MKLEYKTYQQIQELLIKLDGYAVCMHHDYNLISEKERRDIYEHQLTITRALREITGVNAYRAKIEEALEQERLQLIEENKECVEEFISTISEELTAMKNPQYYRNYSLNKEATSAADLFDVTIQQHPSGPPVEPTYPNATKEEWLVAIENAKKHFEEEYENAKQYNNPDSEENKTFAAAFGLPHNHFFPPVVLKEVFVDEDVLALTSGFMLGPVGMFDNKAVQASYTQKYDNIHEMLIFLKAQAKTQDIIVYLTYKEGDKYFFRGAFVEKK